MITQLALSRITSKKARSGVICAAIFLTIVLFMTIVSISVNLLSGYGLMMRMASGTDYHGYLRTAAFTLTGKELRDAARESKDIAEAVISSNVAQYALTEGGIHGSSDVIRALEREQDLQHFYTDIIEGRFPATDDEILVNPLYFPDAKVGDSVGLYYIQYADRNPATAYAEFMVSGLIRSRTDAQMNVVMRYSDTLEETYGFSSRYLNVYFMFENSMNLAGKYDALISETLGEYKNPEFDRFGVLNQAYLEASAREALNPANIFLILFSVATVFFCSFLLIYNVYSIALTQDMQSFGLLNVIGMTHKQMRRMICMQSLILFAATLPAGLLAGYFIGWKMLSPVLFSSLAYEGLEFEFSAWIPLLTVLLTLCTLLWSAIRPLKRLKSLTPIATVDYSPAADLPKRYVRRKNFVRKNVTPNTGRLAKYTISRHRKKTVITAMSMSVSVILFILIETIAEYGMAYIYDNLQKTDYIIKPAYEYHFTGTTEGYSAAYGIDEGVSLADEYISSLENNIFTEKLWTIRTAVIRMDTPASTRRFLSQWKEKCLASFWHPIQQQILDGRMETVILSIPDEFLPFLLAPDLEEIGDGYGNGYVFASYTPSMVQTKETYAPYYYFEEGGTIALGQDRYKIKYVDFARAAYKICGYLSNIGDRPVLLMPEHHFLDNFGEGMTYALLLDVKDDCYELMRTEIERMSENLPLTVDTDIRNSYDALYAETYNTAKEILSTYAFIDGRMDGLNEMKETMRAIQTVGYSLAAMIFLIGSINIVNTALSSVTERKREFAMLEAVGMTDKQLMKMLFTESLYGGWVAVLITVCVGFPVIAILINTAMDALVSLKWLAGAIMLAVCIAVSIFSGLAVFRLTKSAAVVERIKVE